MADLRKLPHVVFCHLGREGNDAEVTHPDFDGRVKVDHITIRVDKRLKGRKRLNRIIHEALHGAMPALREENVESAGNYISRVLHHLGYRVDPDIEEWQNVHYTHLTKLEPYNEDK